MLGKCRFIKLLKLAIVVGVAVGFLSPQIVVADVQNFHFSKMHTNYHLSRGSDGISKMQVEETLVAQFPTFNQNKGIERLIPYTNQDGANITLDDTSVIVTRNGRTEPIWETEKTKLYYKVATGTDDYILGEQTFGFKYVMNRVITDFSDHQELYWDVNGTGWNQRFDSVSATIYFDDASANAFSGETACYTGAYMSKEHACTVTAAPDGQSVTVTADRALGSGENLTFVLGFAAGAFVVPEVPTSYTEFIIGIIALVATILLAATTIIRCYRKVHTAKKQHERPIIAEYLPPKDISVYMARGMIQGTSKSGNVLTAQIIDLAVRHNLKIVEEEKKGLFGKTNKVYFLELLSHNGLRSDEIELIKILFPDRKNRIEVKSSIPASTTLALQSFDRTNEKRLKTDGYYNDGKGLLPSRTGLLVFGLLVLVIAQIIALVYADSNFAKVFAEDMLMLMLIATIALLSVAGIVVGGIVAKVTTKLTDKGWDMYYYLKGLELYIKIAETERLKFLQSVKGAERVNVDDKAAIVKLYEKLLPYAILFGQEKSWASTIQIYSDELGTSPDWVSTAGAFSLASFMSSSSGSFASSMSSSYGSSSSSGFGGGGGSGGGGGGGGGGGR